MVFENDWCSNMIKKHKVKLRARQGLRRTWIYSPCPSAVFDIKIWNWFQTSECQEQFHVKLYLRNDISCNEITSDCSAWEEPSFLHRFCSLSWHLSVRWPDEEIFALQTNTREWRRHWKRRWRSSPRWSDFLTLWKRIRWAVRSPWKVSRTWRWGSGTRGTASYSLCSLLHKWDN